PMPILLERKEDYPGDDASIIDLEKLAGNPLLLVVVTADNRFVVGYDVIATYTATNTGQPADVVVKVSGKVEAEFGQKKVLFLEVPNDKIFAGSNVTATYELRKPNGDLVGSSSTATATVTGSTPIDLLPPSLVAPAINPIDVLAYPNGVTVRIEYLGAQEADRARLVEVNPPAGSPQFPLVEFNSDKQVDTVLSPAFLAARHGKIMELRWNLNRNGGQAGKSPATQMSVLKIADGDSRLPTPEVPQATGDTLDLTSFSGDARVTCKAWPQSAAGQRVWLRAYGTLENGSNYSITLLEGVELTESGVTNGLNEVLLRSELEKLKSETELRIELKVSFNGSNNESEAVEFSVLKLLVVLNKIWSEEDFESEPAWRLARGEYRIVKSGLRITCVQDSSSFSYGVFIDDSGRWDPAFDKRLLYLHPNAIVRIDFERDINEIEFLYANSQRSVEVKLFSAETGGEIDSFYPPQPTYVWPANLIKHRAKSSFRYLKIIGITGPNGGGTWIDNIKWR
ncbi:hypothetical protein DEU51_1351, partial [Pseudomonas jessenii]